MGSFKIKHLACGGLITNYFCTSRCGHCLYNCSPDREKQYITPQTAEENLKKIRSLGCGSVHVGGGEPFLRPDALGKLLEIAEDLDVSIEYVETNSSWFKDSESAVALLGRLRQKGLHTLLISISPFHNEHIPFSKISGVIEAARRTGIGVFPWIADFISDLSQFDPAEPHTLEEYLNAFGPDYLQRILKRYWIHMGGRALETFRPLLAKKTFTQILEQNLGDCSAELADTSHFHVDLFGNYIPGLCSGLGIFREDLGKSISEENYPILSILFKHGIRGLVALARQLADFTPQKDLYINKCDLCTEIRTFLMQNDYRGSNELNPREFYKA